MARIVHLSDVHFGANDSRIVAAATAWVESRRPDLIIISGDLTQRARIDQFEQASAWINRLRQSGLVVLVIPGNHDIPFYDIFRRFWAPLHRYKHFISKDLCPWFENDQVAVLGINTARSLTFKDGRINGEQLQMLRSRFAAVAPGKTRILVTHHPLFAMPIGRGGELSEAVGRHEDAVAAVSEAGVHIALAGHFHKTFADSARKMVETAGRALVIQAGTATSTRLRNNEPQSFNWLHAHPNNRIELQVVVWNGSGFARRNHIEYSLDGEEWSRREIDERVAPELLRKPI